MQVKIIYLKLTSYFTKVFVFPRIHIKYFVMGLYWGQGVRVEIKDFTKHVFLF